MNYVIVAPMEQEAKLVNKWIEEHPESTNHYTVVECGIGKANAAVNLTRALMYEFYAGNEVDAVFLTGFAAGSRQQELGSLVIPRRVVDYQVDVPQVFNKDIPNNYEIEGIDNTTVLCGDAFIDAAKADALITKYGGQVIFDMESSAVAATCNSFELPLTVVKVISDRPQEDDVNTFQEFVNNTDNFNSIMGFIDGLN